MEGDWIVKFRIFIMGAFSIWHWLILLAVVLVLFGGGGKLSQLMGDFGKGLRVFKKNVSEDNNENSEKIANSSETNSSETESKDKSS